MTWSKKEIKDLRTLFKELVGMMEEQVPYADILALQISRRMVNKDKSGLDVSDGNDRGVKIRVYDGKQFYVYGTSNLDPKELKKHAKELASKVTLLPGMKLGKNQRVRKPILKNFSSKSKINPAKVSVQKKVDACNKMYARVNKASDVIINTRVVYAERIEEKLFVCRKKIIVSAHHRMPVYHHAFCADRRRRDAISFRELLQARF